MVYGYYYKKNGVEIPVETGADLPEGELLLYRDSGVPEDFLRELEQETIGDLEDDIFNPNQDIKDW